VTAQYQVIINDPVLEDEEIWARVEGLRLVRVIGPWIPPGEIDRGMKLCLLEDDGAPPEMDGKLVDISIGRDISATPPRIYVDSRTVTG
jgi:hypothetical protein